MKKVKRDAASFKKMNAIQMKKIEGGYYVYYTNPDGTITRVEV
jgi:hypothetical protein